MALFEAYFEGADKLEFDGEVADAGCTLTVNAAAARPPSSFGCEIVRPAWAVNAYLYKLLAAPQATLYSRMFLNLVSGGLHVTGTFGAFLVYPNLTLDGVMAAFGIYNDNGILRPAVRTPLGVAFDPSAVFPTGFVCFEGMARFAADGEVNLWTNDALFHVDLPNSAGIVTQQPIYGQYYDWGGHGLETVVHIDDIIADVQRIGCGVAPPEHLVSFNSTPITVPFIQPTDPSPVSVVDGGSITLEVDRERVI